MVAMKITKTYCDLCAGRGEETPATHDDVLVQFGTKIVVTDLCDSDEKHLAEALFQVFAQGRRPEGMKTPTRRRTRAEIDAANVATEAAHEAGELRTVKPPGTPGRPKGKWDDFWVGNGKYRCPDPDCTYPPFNGPSGIGRHVKTRHPTLAAA